MNLVAVAWEEHFQYTCIFQMSLTINVPQNIVKSNGFTFFQEQHFINDTLRSEFHKKFMQKYVK